MTTLARPSLGERARASPARLSILVVGGLLLAAVWLLPLSMSYQGLTDPEAAYRSTAFQTSDPWEEYNAADEATAIRVILGIAIAIGVISILALGAIVAMVLTGRVGWVLAAVLATGLVLAAALYLRGYGFWDARSLLLAALAWLGGTVAGFVGTLPRGEPGRNRSMRGAGGH